MDGTDPQRSGEFSVGAFGENLSGIDNRHLPRIGKAKHYVHERLPSAVRDIATKAQARLCARYRALSGRGKKLTVAVTAIARELAGFVWAIGREVQPM